MKIKNTFALPYVLSSILGFSWLMAADVPPSVQAKAVSVQAKLVPIGVDGLTIFVPLPITTPPDTQPDPPKKMAEDFVAAYLAGNDALMQTLTFQDSIDALKAVDDKTRDAFEDISSFKEIIYFHGFKSVVVASTTVVDTSGFIPIPQLIVLKFYFSWVGNRWVLEKVI